MENDTLLTAQALIGGVTVLGSGLSVYVGIRVALAEIRKDIQFLKEKDVQTDKKIDRLFDKVFT